MHNEFPLRFFASNSHDSFSFSSGLPMTQWQTGSLVVGLIHLLLPLITWNILYRRHDRRAVALWCSGSLLFGLGFMLVSFRQIQPVWLSFGIAGPLAFAGYPLRCAALRRELGRGGADVVYLAAWAAVMAVYVGCFLFADALRLQLVVSNLTHLAGAVTMCWLAWQLRHQYRSAVILALTSGAFSVALGFRLVVVALPDKGGQPLAITMDFALMFGAAFLSALFGNLAYIGMALESANRKELRSAAALARGDERLLQTEIRLREQAALLEERARLLAQRDEMLGSLAHEVRQPLNNALAALTSASHAIEQPGDDHGGARLEAAARLRRANAVLMQVNSALDNTLSDAVLLGGQAPVSRQDVDVDVLIDLALGDIDPQNHSRVMRARDSPTRTAAMNVGLMRLALRNVIANALAYSPPESTVVVRIADSDEPLAIVFEVCDQGPGIDAELLPQLFERGSRGRQLRNAQGHGLGLYIVRRVMELHGGEALVAARAEGGLSVRLVVPQ